METSEEANSHRDQMKPCDSKEKKEKWKQSIPERMRSDYCHYKALVAIAYRQRERREIHHWHEDTLLHLRINAIMQTERCREWEEETDTEIQPETYREGNRNRQASSQRGS